MVRKFIYLFIVGLIATSCANQQPITGGPRDEDPPKLLSSVPDDQSTNYRGTTILLEFDEFVNAQNIKKELIITPITKVKYTTKVKKGVFVEIKLDSALEENTTYTFNFRNAIADITEKNPAVNLKLAYSTGPVIDSLTLEGAVTDLMTNEPIKDATVILFAADDTLTIDGGAPMYLSKTNESGAYLIENLKQAAYQVLVIKEEDNNLKYNKPEEKIGFLSSSIQLDSNLVDVDLSLMEYDYKALKLISGRSNKQYVDFKFNKAVESFELEIKEEAWRDKVFAKKEGELIRLFNTTLAETDSFEVRLKAMDKTGTEIDTTKFIQFFMPNKLAQEPFTAVSLPKSGQSFTLGDSLELMVIFTKPVQRYSFDSVYQTIAVNDSTIDTIAWHVNPVFEEYRTVLKFPSIQLTKPLALNFGKGTFVSVEGDTLEATQLKYGLYNEENYGIVNGKIETEYNSFIIQLMADGKVEQEIMNDKSFSFRHVAPGTKTIRILIDENGNGKWDAGDYKTNTMPEGLYFYSAPLPVKANWEVETELIKF